MPESPEDYRDRWLEERFANIELQLQYLKEGQDQTRLALRELRDEVRELHERLTGLRDEVRSDNLRYFQATVRWLVGMFIALSALTVALFSLLASAGAWPHPQASLGRTEGARRRPGPVIRTRSAR